MQVDAMLWLASHVGPVCREALLDRFTSMDEVLEQMRRCLAELDRRGHAVPAAHLCLALDLLQQPSDGAGRSVFNWAN